MPVRYADEKTKMETLAEVTEKFRNQGYGTGSQQEKFEDEIYCSAFVKNKALWEKRRLNSDMQEYVSVVW